MKLWEILPTAAFLGGYLFADISVATAAAMAATCIGLAVMTLRRQPVPTAFWVSGGLLALFGSLTLILDNPAFIKMKPTFVFGTMATLLAGALALGRNPMAAMLGRTITLSPQAWRRLAQETTALLVVLALLNELVWRTLPEHLWVAWKVVAAPLLSTLLLALRLYLLSRTPAPPDITAGK